MVKNTWRSTSVKPVQEPADPRDVRAFAPKMFSTNGSEKDPVAVYRGFAEKIPEKMNDPNAPFYIVVNNVKPKSTDKCWFKCNAVGQQTRESYERNVKKSGS